MKKAKDLAKRLLEEGKVAGVLGLREVAGHVVPYLFRHPQEVEQMCWGDRDRPGQARYPLPQVVTRIARAHPQETFAVVVRGCEERALRELFKWEQLDPQRIVLIGIGCPEELARACGCEKPFPDCLVDGPRSQAEGTATPPLARLEQMDREERLRFWQGELSRCIKCFGCRNVCPLCFCRECALEDPELVERGELPPEVPLFHLVRAVHMAGRCVDCGLCEEACPADIPLRSLYKEVNRIVAEEFGYRPGVSEQRSPFNLVEVR